MRAALGPHLPALSTPSALLRPRLASTTHRIRISRPKCSIAGRHGSMDDSALQGPGPGQYNATGGLQGARWGFGTSQRPRSARSANTPGPGTYGIPDTPKRGGITMVGRPHTRERAMDSSGGGLMY